MSKMIELHDIDVPGFLSVLDSCEGNVYYSSEPFQARS